MSKLIIWVTGRPSLDGYCKREFKWSEDHRAFIYEGRELSDTEFNAAFEKAFRNNQDLLPQVRVVSSEAPQTNTGTAFDPPPISTISVAREITVEDAEAVLVRLAPHRLKGKAGRPPNQPRVLDVA